MSRLEFLNRPIEKIVLNYSLTDVQELTEFLGFYNDFDSVNQAYLHGCYRGRIKEMFLHDLLSAWRRMNYTASPVVVAGIIEACASVSQTISAATTRIELAWTGPWPKGRACNLLPTAQVIAEIISNATRRLVISGYALSSVSPFLVEVLERLARAKRKGCEVTFILNDTEDNCSALIENWPCKTNLPEVLTWRRDIDDIGVVHAKFLLADGRDLLVTSANLSTNGLDKNIEMGIRITGPEAIMLFNHLESLREEGTLVLLELN